MQDLLKTYFIEAIDKRVKHINMYEKEEDKGTGMWEELIKFFAMSGYGHALHKGDLIEIAIQPKSGKVFWIHLIPFLVIGYKLYLQGYKNIYFRV